MNEINSLQRPPRDWVLMKSASLWSERSTCSRAQVGAVVSRNGRILSTGYNGAPSGMGHCDHIECLCDYEKHSLGGDPSCPKHGPCTNVVHAEANAIAFAAKYGVGIEGSELHSTRIPCINCAGMIINAGITRVVWFEEHRDMTGLLRLGDAGLEVIRYTRD